MTFYNFFARTNFRKQTIGTKNEHQNHFTDNKRWSRKMLDWAKIKNIVRLGKHLARN